MTPAPLALTVVLMAVVSMTASGPVQAQAPAPASEPSPVSASEPALLPATSLKPLPRSDAAKQLPIVLRARTVTSRPDLDTVAEGDVEFRRGGTVIRADRIAYDVPSDLATAKGNVRVSRDGAVYSGPELEVSVQRFEGFFLRPSYEFMTLGAGGRADRVEFLGAGRSRATNASYTSCPREDPTQEPDWVLRTDRVTIDLDANEGLAEGAVLRFLGVPILALPALSFPLGDGRKSGWLPPSINIDNRSGLVVSVPYYWNIAPNRDMTIAPRAITRRGLGLDTEFRYLEPSYSGNLRVDWLPNDRISARSRESVQWQHDATLPWGFLASANAVKVSDADWWKDFPDAGRSFTPRLLPVRLELLRPFGLSARGEGLFYARSQHWQLLQDSDSFILAPYQRSPQVGVSLAAPLAWGFEAALQSEFNRFTLPNGQAQSTQRPVGDRWHLLGSIARPWREPGWWVVPKLSLNAAAYDSTRLAKLGQALERVDLPRERRVIPSLSIDAGLELERRTTYFGRELHQTLEPRLLYVRTPFRDQSAFPNYDAAAKDFNFVSLYSDNTFAGVDRVSDADQLTAGFTTRLVDANTGVEALRLGLVQRYLFRNQRIAPQADGSPGGPELDQRFSDALLLGSTSVFPGWSLDAAVQYSPDIQRSVRSILGARYSPGPYRTVNATYRLARGLSEQLEMGWQWPLAGRTPAERAAETRFGAATNANNCSGAWYSVGRINYSLKDRRVTDAVLGLEYDAGCWIGRIVAEQLSIGRSQATTRLLVQLELVGLSRLGSNPLKVLKDNIPGYRLLREERGPTSEDRLAPVFHD